MKVFICLFTYVAYTSASAILLGGIPDDGQWRPWLDRSILGASPGLATALLGSAQTGILNAGHIIGKRSLGAIALGGLINPNALNVPLDTVQVAVAKNAQLISQATEGARNIIGAGVPLALPADTPEVAIGKAAHAIAHDTEKLAVAARNGISAGILASPVAAVAGVRPVATLGLGLNGALLGHGIL